MLPCKVWVGATVEFAGCDWRVYECSVEIVYGCVKSSAVKLHTTNNDRRLIVLDVETADAVLKIKSPFALGDVVKTKSGRMGVVYNTVEAISVHFGDAVKRYDYYEATKELTKLEINVNQ